MPVDPETYQGFAAKAINDGLVRRPMAWAARLLVTFLLTLLVATTLSGCLDNIVETTCPTTAVGGTWTQQGLWESLPEEGSLGPYNLTLWEPAGFPFEDPEYNEVVLSQIEWDPRWEENGTGAFYRLDENSRISITVPRGFDEDRLAEGFDHFIQHVAIVDEDKAHYWFDMLLGNRVVSPGGTTGDAEAGTHEEASMENESLVEYSIQIDAEFRFEALYEELLSAHDMNEPVDPWDEGHVDIGDWRFVFPVPFKLAEHTTEEGRSLRVDERDRVFFHWNPPAGIDESTLLVGIERTLTDLDIVETPEITDLEVTFDSC